MAPGIGIGIGIDRGGGGINWSSYWTTHIAQFNMVVDGHSFLSAADPVSAMSTYLPYSLTFSAYSNQAVGGQYINDVIGRSALTDSKLVTETLPIQNILVVWIGFPDDTEGSGEAAWALLKPYFEARLAAGWRVVTFTATPCLVGAHGVQYETVERPAFNNLLKTDLVNSKYHVIDTDLISELDDSTNLRYYADGIHPALGGAALVMDAFLALMESIYTSNVLPVFTIPALNTVGSFDHEIGVTKNESNHVSVWADELEQAGSNFVTVGGTPIHSDDGILFDGVNDMLKTAAIAALDQPTTVYIVVKQITWTIVDKLFDGVANDRGWLGQSTVTPSLRIYAGTTESSNYLYLPLDTWAIVRVCFNGAASYIRVNNENKLVASIGTNNLGGFTIGARGDGLSAFSHCQYKKIVLRDVAESAELDYQIHYHLRRKYGL